MDIGCTRCPEAGHFELRECPDAYTERAKGCGLYDHSKYDDQREVQTDDKDPLRK